MRRRNITQDEGPGQDSFLDIVANLVGILIILVMVIGVRAKDAILEAAPADAPAIADESEQREAADLARDAATAVKADVFEIDAKIKSLQFDIDYRRAERERVQLLVTAIEDELAKQRGQLSASQQAEFDRRTALQAAQSELTEIRNQVRSLENAAAPVALIEHLPTPMAKTVFGREIHVSLRHNRVQVIPWEALIAELKEDAPRTARRMQSQDQLTETLGPIGGFWMKYTLAKKRQAVTTRIGVAVQQGVELDHFVLLPVAEDLGEPVDQALQPGSNFRDVLAQHRPDATTITVWTFSDSFESFRRLKQTLYPLGFLVASRPLPDGFPIGGSPNGMRSAAQ